MTSTIQACRLAPMPANNTRYPLLVVFICATYALPLEAARFAVTSVYDKSMTTPMVYFEGRQATSIDLQNIVDIGADSAGNL